MDWMRLLTVSGRTLSAAHFSINTGGMWLYMSRLSTDSGSKPRESMNCLQDKKKPVSRGVHRKTITEALLMQQFTQSHHELHFDCDMFGTPVKAL